MILPSLVWQLEGINQLGLILLRYQARLALMDNCVKKGSVWYLILQD